MAAGKALKDAGVEFDVFESSDRVGGLWVYENPNGKAAAYRGLHSNAPKPLMGYAEYPLPGRPPGLPEPLGFRQVLRELRRPLRRYSAHSLSHDSEKVMPREAEATT